MPASQNNSRLLWSVSRQ